MGTMNISLPDRCAILSRKQVAQGGYGSVKRIRSRIDPTR